MIEDRLLRQGARGYAASRNQAMADYKAARARKP